MSVTRRSLLQATAAAAMLPLPALAQTMPAPAPRGPYTGGRIDVHCHFLPDFYAEALVAAGHGKPDGFPMPAWNAETMLRNMDALGIERAYLSISSPGVNFGDDAAARDLSRRVNDEAAPLKRAWPDRLGFFAATPLPDTHGALAEIERAYGELDADGVVFMTNFRGAYLGDELLEPVYQALDRQQALLFLHPTSPGSQCGCGVAHEDLGYPRPMLEFLFDTTRTVTDMVLSGVLARHPGLTLLVPHAGATLPILANRIDLISQLASAPGTPPKPSMREAIKAMHFASGRRAGALATAQPAGHRRSAASALRQRHALYAHPGLCSADRGAGQHRSADPRDAGGCDEAQQQPPVRSKLKPRNETPHPGAVMAGRPFPRGRAATGWKARIARCLPPRAAPGSPAVPQLLSSFA